MIAIIDYDAGNIKSVEKALLSLGQEVTVTAKQDEILGADKIVLPGVGAFGDAIFLFFVSLFRTAVLRFSLRVSIFFFLFLFLRPESAYDLPHPDF